MIQVRLPNITAPTDAGQIAQMRSYLYQLAEQLNWALSNVSEETPSPSPKMPSQSITEGEKKAQDNFNEVKALIIKSADIVNAYYEEIDTLLKKSGEYTASSDFGEYKERIDTALYADETGIVYKIDKVESIADEVGQRRREQDAYIKMGIVGTTLDDVAANDAPGIELGDFRSETNRQRFARFTPYGLELFGSDTDNAVAYIKQDRLFISTAEITKELKIGGYTFKSTNGLAICWEGS